jgi:hypothetical protein
MVDPCILHPFRAPVLRVRCAGAPGTADLPQRTLSDFTVYFTTFLRKKIHPPRGFSTSSKMFVEKRIENGGRWGDFLLASSVQRRSAGPEAGRGVPTPPSLPLDSTHPATGQGLLALDNPKEEVEAQKS